MRKNRVVITAAFTVLAFAIWFLLSSILGSNFADSHPNRDTGFIYFSTAFLFALVTTSLLTLSKSTTNCFFKALAYLSLLTGFGSLIFFSISILTH